MIIAWTSAQHVFAVKTFFKACESLIAAQRAFCAHFILCWNDAVLAKIFNP